jgi:hypothetical protein
MGFDLENDYFKVKEQISSVNSYKDLKDQYDKQRKKLGTAFEQSAQKISSTIDQAKKDVKRFQKQVKTQLDQLFDINNVTGGRGSGSVSLIKRIFLTVIKNIQPLLDQIVNDEIIKLLGCDQQQTYVGETSYYIKIASIDLFGMLKKNPSSDIGKLVYEKNPLQVQISPFAMNKELYNRIQNPNDSFFDQYGSFYRGQSGQFLFDIKYEPQDDNGVDGPWFKVTLKNRVGGPNKIIPFLLDYYKSIKIVEFPNIMVGIMDALTGCLSISGNLGLEETQDKTRFNVLLQRILGLCFDNVKEIDITGTAKLAELDGIDESFFEFTEIDLRNIEQTVNNILNRVVQYENCDNIALPIDALTINNALSNLFFVKDEDLVDAAADLTKTLTQNEQWQGLTLSGNILGAIDLNFIKAMVMGIISALLSPKLLLPIFLMLKVLGRNIQDTITSLADFGKIFKKFILNVVSRIGAIFTKELFEIVSKNIKEILQRVILDLAKEKADKRITIILKLIQLLIVVAEFISDWRRCKSVVDELLWLLKIAISGFGGRSLLGGPELKSGGAIPYPLLLAARFLDGYSETRAFIGTVEEMQKLGIPTGPMPDGSPNLGLLAMFGQMKAMAKEDAENGKVEVAVDPLSFTPAGLTNGIVIFGKKL